MKTITIPLELAEALLGTFHNDNCWDEALHGQLESLIKGESLIVPPQNFTATDVISDTEAYFKNLAESIETKSDFNIWLSKLNDHLLIKAAMGKGDNHA